MMGEDFERRVQSDYKMFKGYYPNEHTRILKLVHKFGIPEKEVERIVKQIPVPLPEMIDKITDRFFGATIPRDMLNNAIKDFENE